MTERDAFEIRLRAAVRGYVGRVSSDLDPVEFAHRIAAEQPRRRGLAAALTWRGVAIPRLAWVLLLATLLAAMIGGMLYVGSRIAESPRRHPAALVPTGVGMLALESSTFGGAAADPTGAVWASIGGALARLGPASGAVRTWTVADDAAFGNIAWIVPARGGGVWLVPPVASGDQALRWFDGERFRDVVPAPPGSTDLNWGGVGLAEAPDGSLWAGAFTGLFRWDGTSWSAAPEGRPTAGVSALAIDRSGAVWVGNCENGACSGFSRYDGTRWETFAMVASVTSIREAPDGSIWVSGGDDLWRYDGHAWTRLGGDLPQRLGGWNHVTWADDGTAWVTSCAYFQGEVLIARYDGTAWVEYTAADGLPRSTNCGQVFATAHGVYVATGDGLYRLVGDHWERAWPVTPSSGPWGEVSRLVPVSRDEAWATDQANGVWHFADGAWTRLPVPEQLGVTWDLLPTPDGTLWATLGTQDRIPDDPGLYALRGTEWMRVGTGSADLLAVDRKGVLWVAGSESSDPSVVVVRSLGFDGRTWSESAPTPSTDLVYQVPRHLAIGRDGAIWVGGSVVFPMEAPPAGWNVQSGLMRYLGGRWEPVRPRGGSSPFAVLDLTVAPNGDVWVVGADVSTTDPTNPTELGPPWIARFDGTRWAVFGQDGAFPEPGQQATIVDVVEAVGHSSVAAGPNGTIWVATTSGLARFDGVTWTTLYRGVRFSAVSVAPDGTVWVSAPFGVTRIAASATSP